MRWGAGRRRNMDWENWDWFFGPDGVRHPVSDGTEPEEENFTFGILTEEDSDRETEDENGIW